MMPIGRDGYYPLCGQTYEFLIFNMWVKCCVHLVDSDGNIRLISVCGVTVEFNFLDGETLWYRKCKDEIMKENTTAELDDLFSDVTVETVIITKEKYDELVAESEWLCALEAAGVDNWDGCSQAKDILEEWENEK